MTSSPRQDGSPGIAARIDRALSDAVMGFFALTSLFLGFAPPIFDPDPALLRAIEGAELAIVAVFAVEYAAGLACAPSRVAYLRNPWRVLDALIIVLGLASLLEPLGGALRSAPALRLIRLGRLALFGTRTGGALVAEAVASAPASPSVPAPLEVCVAEGDESLRFVPVSWEAALDRIRSASRDWILVSGIEAQRLAEIAAALDVPEATLRARLFESVLPRIERMERYTALFCWYVASFQMNKVMRLLAILTALTLIPAVTGGLLGMNLADNPWPTSLSQVAFGVAAGMALSLYLFAIKGWFR